jgi:signal transduction histidine kinase
VTDGDQQQTFEAFPLVREIVRRAGHEIRNSLNGVAVNVEVVRARTSRGSHDDIASFAERASAQIAEASSLTDALLALTSAVLAAAKNGGLSATEEAGGAGRIELTTYGAGADHFASAIEPLIGRIGVGAEQRGQSVILTISPRSSSHSKV